MARPRSATSGLPTPPWAAESSLIEEHVLGLQIAVDDPERVRAPEGAGELVPSRRASSTANGPRSSRSRSVPPVEERHDEVSAPADLARVEQRHEAVRLAEVAEEPLLAFETRARAWPVDRVSTLTATSRPSGPRAA